MIGVRSAMLRVTDLVKYYGDVRAVDGISFAIPGASVFTILGPNGAGKTTTLEILEGIRDPDSGEIEVFGVRLKRINRAVKERMGVLLQEGNFEPYLKVKEVVALFASFFKSPLSPDAVLANVALEEKANAYVKTLSGGQKQRLAVGVALVNDPDLLFFDEPTTGLDPQARRKIWSIITDLKERGKTIILTTHYMEEAEVLSDNVCIMDHGTIIAKGSPRELAARLGQETIIEFTAPDLSEDDLASLATCDKPSDCAVRKDGDLVTVETEDLAPTMEHMLAWAGKRDLPLKNMVVRQPNLEDVFLSLTGRRLRE
ncbi:ABC transporter ATP-binding protein [Candidatus Bipolaricaulota bacterium]|nr:ABC transporter ATP-binding protein [Candidatus Bipolaricaulota bacterium]